MSDPKSDFQHISHQPNNQLTTITLTPEQFESLYLQPRNTAGKNSLVGKVGNPTPLGIASFLLALFPLSMDLMGFQGATVVSSVAILGTFYACAGIGLYLACIMEWIIGNTFPSVVFGTFGGFWIMYGVTIQPTFVLAASFASAADQSNNVTAAAAGAATPQYNAGLGLYFVVWGILCFIFLIASLRTNVAFAIVFFSLIMVFELLAAGYFHTGQGRTGLAAPEFKAAGAFAFIASLSGLYIEFSLLCAAVGMPFAIPLADLTGWGRRKQAAGNGQA